MFCLYCLCGLNMNEYILNDIYKASEIIINNTLHTDVLLFIGQSPNLMYHIVKNKRQSYQIPFSGMYLKENNKPIKNENVLYFEKMLKWYGVTKNIIMNNNIYFIDYCESGETMKSITHAINITYCISNIYNIIYWTSNTLKNTLLFDKIMFNKQICLNDKMNVDNLNKLINFEDYFKFRTIPKFKFYEIYDDYYFNVNNESMEIFVYNLCKYKKNE